MTQSTVSKHKKKPVGRPDEILVPPGPIYHVTLAEHIQKTAQHKNTSIAIYEHSGMVPVKHNPSNVCPVASSLPLSINVMG